MRTGEDSSQQLDEAAAELERVRDLFDTFTVNPENARCVAPRGF